MAISRNISGAFKDALESSAILNPLYDAKATLQSLSKDKEIVGDQLKLLGINATSIFTDETQYIDLINTTGNAAVSYLTGKVDRLKDAWNTKVEVTVRSIIGEVAPYVVNTKTASKLLLSKLENLAYYLTGVNPTESDNDSALGRFASSLGTDFTDALANNPGVQSSLANLGIVKSYANILNIYSTTCNAVEKVLTIIEPLLPLLQITTNTALSVWSGGTSASLAAEQIIEVGQQECQKVLSLALGSIRKLIYDLPIKVPALLVGALDSISVREAMIGSDNINGWLKAIFSEDFYQSTLYSMQWDSAINEALHDTLGKAEQLGNNWANFNFTDLNGNSITRGEFMKSSFLNTLTQKFMSKAVATARKTAYIQDYTKDSWVSYEKFTKKLKQVSADSNISIIEALNSKKTTLDYLLEDDLELSPIVNLESLQIISKKLIDNI